MAPALPAHSALHMALSGDKAANRTACQGPNVNQALGDGTLSLPKPYQSLMKSILLLYLRCPFALGLSFRRKPCSNCTTDLTPRE